MSETQENCPPVLQWIREMTRDVETYPHVLDFQDIADYVDTQKDLPVLWNTNAELEKAVRLSLSLLVSETPEIMFLTTLRHRCGHVLGTGYCYAEAYAPMDNMIHRGMKCPSCGDNPDGVFDCLYSVSLMRPI